MWERLLRKLSQVFGALGALSLVVLMTVIVVEVFVRFFTRSSVPGMLEVAETALVIAVYFGLAWAGVRGEHVSVEIVVDRLPKRIAWWVALLGWIVSTGVVGWFVYAAALRAISSTQDLEERFGLVRWPIYPSRWVIVVGLVLLLLVFAQNIVRLVQHKPAFGDEADRVAKVVEATVENEEVR